ncbi:MAG TPA: ABC transporter substrate-binding protein [Chloroflexota bacterium]|nr:ABC transporter substrate-binding protein [Chloroflexota bacterium]
MRLWSVVLLAFLLAGQIACRPPAAATSSAPAPPGAQSPSATTPAAAGSGSAPAAPPPRVSMRLGLNAVSASIAPIWLAKDEGIFEKYGFDVELITLQSSSQVAKVMASGEIPVAVSAAAGVVDAALAGDDQVLLSGFQNTMNFWVYSRPEIVAVPDLRGKSLAVTRIGSGIYLGATDMLRKAGLEPDRDVALRQIGGTAEVYGSLVAGAVDAAVVAIPYNFEAQDAGYHLLYDLSAQKIPYLQNGLASSKSYVKNNEDVVRRLMMAHIEGLARVHKDKATTIEVLSRNLKNDDRQLMSRTYDLIEPLFERIPYPAAASIQTVIDQRAEENPAARSLTPAQVSDDHFVRDLETQGFVGQVYN